MGVGVFYKLLWEHAASRGICLLGWCDNRQLAFPIVTKTARPAPGVGTQDLQPSIFLEVGGDGSLECRLGHVSDGKLPRVPTALFT